jgi:hypothetical protein
VVPARYIGIEAGVFRVALPVTEVRQILDVGGAQRSSPFDPRALGVTPISLAALLGHAESSESPALLLFDGTDGPLVLSACRLFGVFSGPEPNPLPSSVPTRWPGLVRGSVRGEAEGYAPGVESLGEAWYLVLDLNVLFGMLEGRS